MQQSTYRTLLNNPCKIEVQPKSREVHFNVISAMCDNNHRISFFRKEDGSYRVSGNGSAMGNFQIPYDEIDLTWAAEDENWSSIASMINEGVQLVSKVRSR